MNVRKNTFSAGRITVTPDLPAPDPHSDRVEALMVAVISAAYDSRPILSAKRNYMSVVATFEGTALKPPSLHRFIKALAAERMRRKAVLTETADRAAERIGSALGNRPVELVVGTSLITGGTSSSPSCRSSC